MAVDSTSAVESLGAIKTIVKQFGKITSKMGAGQQDISQTVFFIYSPRLRQHLTLFGQHQPLDINHQLHISHIVVFKYSPRL